MADAATLPADMLAPTGSLMKDYGAIRSGMQSAAKDEQTAGKEKDAAIAAQRGEIDKERVDLKNFQKDNPFPHPDIKPWTQKPPENNPIERFGSWASAFGILAGAITKTGLASSLNASAAAMNAMRQNDLDGYERARQAWKENTEIAIKNAEWEAKGYQNAFELFKTDQSLAQASALTVAAQADNKAAMAAIKTGDLSKLWSITEGMARFAQEGPKIQWDNMVLGSQSAAVRAMVNQFHEQNPNATPDQLAIVQQQAMAKVQRDIHNVYGLKTLEQEKAAAAIALTDTLDAKFDRDNPHASAEEKALNHADNLRRSAISSGASKEGGGKTGSAMNDRKLQLADSQNKEEEDARKTLSGPELDTKLGDIAQKYDEQRRRLFAPKDAPGAAGDYKDIKAIDDLDPILDAMEALIKYDPSTVGVRAKGNRILGAIKDQLGEDISDPQLRAEQVHQLANEALGPVSMLFTGSGQWTKSRESITRAIVDPTSLMDGPDQAIQDIETLRTQLPQMKQRRMDLLKRKVSPASTPADTAAEEPVRPGNVPDDAVWDAKNKLFWWQDNGAWKSQGPNA